MPGRYRGDSVAGAATLAVVATVVIVATSAATVAPVADARLAGATRPFAETAAQDAERPVAAAATAAQVAMSVQPPGQPSEPPPSSADSGRPESVPRNSCPCHRSCKSKDASAVSPASLPQLPLPARSRPTSVPAWTCALCWCIVSILAWRSAS